MGIEENEVKPIKRKNNGRLSKSLFRSGLDYFHKALKRIRFGRLEFLTYLLSYVDTRLKPLLFYEIKSG